LETIGRDLNAMQRVPLTESHVAALRAAGTVAHYAAGTFLVQSGDRVDCCVYVEDGEIEVVNPFTDERHVPSTLGPNLFMSKITAGRSAATPLTDATRSASRLPNAYNA
jgi:thioredoxin reductase (NADPH)